MSRKYILAIAAVAVLAMSTLVATDASARGGGGGGGHFGGGHGGGHSSFSRTAFHPGGHAMARTTSRTSNHSIRYNRGMHGPRGNHRTHVRHERHRHNHAWWAWCRHHHHRNCGIGVGVYSEYNEVDPVVVADAPRYVAPTPVAAVCTTDCDYFLKDQPGCYMAKRKFSTPQGDELRCVKICEEPDVK